jgi:hypothetical protein
MLYHHHIYKTHVFITVFLQAQDVYQKTLGVEVCPRHPQLISSLFNLYGSVVPAWAVLGWKMKLMIMSNH